MPRPLGAKKLQEKLKEAQIEISNLEQNNSDLRKKAHVFDEIVSTIKEQVMQELNHDLNDRIVDVVDTRLDSLTVTITK